MSNTEAKNRNISDLIEGKSEIKTFMDTRMGGHPVQGVVLKQNSIK